MKTSQDLRASQVENKVLGSESSTIRSGKLGFPVTSQLYRNKCAMSQHLHSVGGLNTHVVDELNASKLSTPFGERYDSRSEVSKVLDFTLKGYDKEIEAVRMGHGSRRKGGSGRNRLYYDPARVQCLQTLTSELYRCACDEKTPKAFVTKHVRVFYKKDYSVRKALLFCLTPDSYFLENPEKILESPVEGNLYGYAGNNPVMNTDPTGDCFGLCVGAIIGAGTVLPMAAAWLAGKAAIKTREVVTGQSRTQDSKNLDKAIKTGMKASVAVAASVASPQIAAQAVKAVGNATIAASSKMVTVAAGAGKVGDYAVRNTVKVVKEGVSAVNVGLFGGKGSAHSGNVPDTIAGAARAGWKAGKEMGKEINKVINNSSSNKEDSK